MWRFATALLLALCIRCVPAAAKAEEAPSRLQTETPAVRAEEGQSPSQLATDAAKIEEARSAMMADLRDDRDRWRSQAEKVTSREGDLVNATYVLAAATAGLVFATIWLVVATKKEHRWRTKMETYKAWKQARAETKIPSEKQMEAIATNWEGSQRRNVSERAADKRERNVLRRNMIALEFFATAVNKWNTLDYEFTKDLAGSWILNQYKKLKRFIVLAKKNGHEKCWVEIEVLGTKLEQEVKAPTIENDESEESQESNKIA